MCLQFPFDCYSVCSSPKFHLIADTNCVVRRRKRHVKPHVVKFQSSSLDNKVIITVGAVGSSARHRYCCFDDVVVV